MFYVSLQSYVTVTKLTSSTKLCNRYYYKVNLIKIRSIIIISKYNNNNMSNNDVHPSDFSNSNQHQKPYNHLSKPYTASSSLSSQRQQSQQQHHISSSTHPIPLNYVPSAKFIDMESKLYHNQAEIDKLIKISLQHR